MPDEPQQPGRAETPLVAVQVLRAVAALMVVIHHAGYDADTLAIRAGRPPLALDRAFDWTFGIHLFFVISGFIMLRTARGFGSPAAAATFAIRRIIRVAPLYWLLTSAVIAGALVAPGLLNMPLGDLHVVAGSFAFLPVMRADGAINPVLGQGWTLDYEMFFYALFSLALLLPRRLGLAALSGALISLPAVGRFAPPGGAVAAVWTGELLLEFLFGLLIGLVAERGVRLPAASAFGLMTMGSFAAIALGPLSPATQEFSSVLRAGLPAALIVAGAVLGPRWPRTGTVLALAAVGDASYSLYLSHPFAIRLLRETWAALVPAAVPLPVFVGLACLAAVAVAIGLYRWFERPMTIALQHRFGAGRRPILPDAAVRSR